MDQFVPTVPKPTKFQKSINDFRAARNRAAMENIINRLTGKSSELLSFYDVTQKLKVVNQAERGVQDIPLEAIVGSVGRYTDFSRTFLPMQDNDATRWARVAAIPFNELPPIDVYQIGDSYFVLDGNHRVSIARQRGMKFIPAEVTEVQTRAPLPPDVSPEKLILQAEYVSFLENTNIDQFRPDAELRVSVPGQYHKLENHMVVNRFFIEMNEERELSDKEAVTRWYDEAYLPVVKAVREQGVLRGFPNRTEADLYIWISEHQAQLRNELGWQVRPEVATADLAARLKLNEENKIAQLSKRLGRTVLNLVMPQDSKAPTQSWSQSKVVARYSDRLFTDLLVVFPTPHQNQVALDQAIVIARREDSRLHGLYLSTGEADTELKNWFENQCRSAGVDGHLAIQIGDPVDLICHHARLADLIIFGRPTENDASLEADQKLVSLIRQAPRPILLSIETTAPLKNIILAYDGSQKSKEALFAAAYMAERWQASISVVMAPKENNPNEKLAEEHARRYLEMHEVEADYLICNKNPLDLIVETAREKNADLIIAGGYSDGLFGRSGSGSVINQLATQWEGALLVCP